MPKVSYMGNGSTTEFAFDFPYFQSSDIIVTKNNATATGYTIIGTSAGQNANIPYTGGKVVFETAPSAIDNITIKRQLLLTRVVDYQPTAKIDPTTLNQDMNYTIEVLKDMWEELNLFHSQYKELVNKTETQTLLNKMQITNSNITEINETITDFNEEIENGRIMSKDDFYSYATNCITEIPQDIKLELNNGTLTLKSGSKIYIPNGDTFDTYIIPTDISATPSGSSGTYGWFLILQPNKTITRTTTLDLVYSGSTAPSGYQYMYWYDTTNNLIKFTTDSGSTWTSGYSLPIALISGTSGVESIDQVFNGFGYIGSTIFALPGIKGLIPNGRNADGTLSNTHYTVPSVITYERNLTGTDIPVFINGDDSMLVSSGISYNREKNIVGPGGYFQIGSVSMTSGVISDLSIKYPLRIADYCDL